MNDRTRAERRLPHHAVFAGQPVERPHSLPARVNRVSQQPAVLPVVFRDHDLDGYDGARDVRVCTTRLSDEVRIGSLRPRDPRHELHSMAEWWDGEWYMVQWELGQQEACLITFGENKIISLSLPRCSLEPGCVWGGGSCTCTCARALTPSPAHARTEADCNMLWRAVFHTHPYFCVWLGTL